MKLKREWCPAHTEYFLVAMIRGERATYYNGQVYRTLKLAQADADKMNARRNPKAGKIIVESIERPGAWSLIGTLRF